MRNNKQVQKAGDNSSLNQTIINNYHYADDNKTREIVDKMMSESLGKLYAEAGKIVDDRVNTFKENFFPELVKENLVFALKEPSIQRSLFEAMRSAASTERDSDYELLSTMLIDRIKKGNDRYAASSINHAVKIVPEITDEALLGLTAAYSVLRLVPNEPGLNECLNTLNSLFSAVIYDKLPQGVSWIRHLDMLDAVRIDTSHKLCRLEDIYQKKLSGYFEEGTDNPEEFFRQWDSFDKLKALRLWWNEISPAFMITPIGEALAQANAENHCKLRNKQP